MMIAEKSLADVMGTHLYGTGAVATDLVGLRAIVASSNTIGGISQSTNSWWGASTVDSTTATFSIAALQTAYNAQTINNESPDLITATRANYNRFYAALQPQQRFTDSETAKAGFSNLMFNGSKFISDSKCPANHIFLLNTNYLHLYVHKDEDFRFSPWQKVIDQNIKVGQIFWMGAFGSSNIRMLGKFSAVAA